MLAYVLNTCPLGPKTCFLLQLRRLKCLLVPWLPYFGGLIDTVQDPRLGPLSTLIVLESIPIHALFLWKAHAYAGRMPRRLLNPVGSPRSLVRISNFRRRDFRLSWFLPFFVFLIFHHVLLFDLSRFAVSRRLLTPFGPGLGLSFCSGSHSNLLRSPKHRSLILPIMFAAVAPLRIGSVASAGMSWIFSGLLTLRGNRIQLSQAAVKRRFTGPNTVRSSGCILCVVWGGRWSRTGKRTPCLWSGMLNIAVEYYRFVYLQHLFARK